MLHTLEQKRKGKGWDIVMTCSRKPPIIKALKTLELEGKIRIRMFKVVKSEDV